MPSPLLADTCSTAMSGLIDRACSMQLSDVEVEMRQQVDLGQDHHARGGKSVRIFQRLVVSLGHREDRHFQRLAEIEAGRTNEVADILDEQDRVALERQALERVPDHMRVEVTAAAGIDLKRGHARGADTRGIERGLLVALDHGHGHRGFQHLDGLDQERGLARARARYEVDGENAGLAQALPVLACIGVVPGEDVLLDAHEVMRMSRRSFVVMMIVVVVIVVVVMLALMAATAYAAHWSFSSG